MSDGPAAPFPRPDGGPAPLPWAPPPAPGTGLPPAPPQAGPPAGMPPAGMPPVGGPPYGPPAQPTDGRPPRRRVPGWAVGVGIACTVALVGGLGLVASTLLRDDAAAGSAAPGPSPSASTSTGADLGESEYAHVWTDVDPAGEVVLPIEFDPADVLVDGQPAQPWDVAEVFLDPLLTVEAPDAEVTVDDGRIRIAPRSQPVEAWGLDKSVVVSPGGRWGMSDHYFVAEHFDPTTGAALAEPRVSAFTLATELPTVGVTFTVDDDGVGHFSWEAVEGATAYFVIALDTSYRTAGGMAEIIGDADTTTWTTVEDDEYLQETIAEDDWFGVKSQNHAFETYVMAEDDLHDATTVVEDEENSKPRAYGIVAMTPDGVSPLSLLRDPGIAAQLPATAALNAIREIGRLAAEETGGVGRLPVQYPVTMADGRTVMKSMTYDPESVVLSSDIINGEFVEGYYVQYHVLGTLMSGRLRVPEATSEDDAKVRVQAVNEQALAARPRTGQEPAYSYRTGTVEVTDVSTTAPEVPYPVYGSTPLTKYLAANIVAGKSFISVADYLEGSNAMTSTGVDLYDAVGEALSQNPYALGHVELSYLSDRKVLAVFYTSYTDMAAREADQAALAAEVDAVVARIVDDSMSDEEKVTAINDYLTSTAEYDMPAYDARWRADVHTTFPHAWSAVGVLLDKKGVCASYAHAFDVLADAAGLESMYVTGMTTDGSGHAWNKVRVGDTWRVVDATWNDSPAGNQSLLLTDAAMAETRVEDADWVIDTRIGDYAAR